MILTKATPVTVGGPDGGGGVSRGGGDGERTLYRFVVLK